MNYAAGLAALLSAILFVIAWAGATIVLTHAGALALFSVFCLVWYFAFEWRR